MKKCTKCGEIKPLTDFNRAKKGKGGLSARCRRCSSEVGRAWQKENREKARAALAKWRKENPEKEKARNAEYRKENREKARAAFAKWRKENPDKVTTIHIIKAYKQKGIPKEMLTEDLLETHLLNIKIKRLCKTLKS